MVEIEIVEGHDPSSYFCFQPVYVKNKDKIILDDDIKELDEEFSIEEGYVECFLWYFLNKHFDRENIYNKNRYECGMGYVTDFEWYITHNFFTYQSIKVMLQDISCCADRLETDYDDPVLDDLKKWFSIFYMCSPDSEDYKSGNDQAIRKHIAVVIDFYRRFVKRLTLMMENNPEAFLISIMGP